jgi:hypothetical protein
VVDPSAGGVRIDAAIVGAQKCGTTSLAGVLGGHPDICLAAGKEAHLFDRADVQAYGPTDGQLAAAFPDRHPGQLLLDATPSYFYLPGCLEALVRHAPDVRVIVVVRSPARRAVSHHGHERRLGFERLPFLAAVALEGRRLRRDSDVLAQDSAHRHASYLDRGRYAPQMARLRSLTDRVTVVTLDGLVTDPTATLHRLQDFLGVDRREVGAFPRDNAGDGRRRRLATGVAAVALRRATREAEQSLDLPAGALR